MSEIVKRKGPKEAQQAVVQQLYLCVRVWEKEGLCWRIKREKHSMDAENSSQPKNLTSQE